MQQASRLTIAISLSAAMILGGIGIAGFVTAADEEPLTTFSMPRPMAGDEARYDYMQIEGGLETPTIVDGPLDGNTIAFRSPRVAFDYDGAPHMVNSFYELTHGYYQLNGDDQVRWNQYADWTMDIDVVDGQVVAYWMVFNERVEDIGDGKVRIYSQGNTHFNEHYNDPVFGHPFQYPCFTFNVFQDGPVQVIGTMPLHGDCHWSRPAGSFGDGYSQYTPLGIETFGDLETIHFVQDSPVVTPRAAPGIDHSDMRTGGTHVWLSEEYPYPVKVAHPMDDMGSKYDVYLLRDFFRGDEPLATAEDQVPDSTGLGLEYAALTPLGPQSSILSDGFTAQDAYDAALADPDLGLQDFLAAHPDAYTGRVFHNTRDHEDRGSEDINVTDWRFHVTAGGSNTLVFNVREEVRTPHDQLGRPEEPVTTVSVEETTPDTDEFPAPADIPEEVPTVDSVARLWQRLGGSEQDANTYAFGIWCGDGCDKPAFHVETGYQRDWDRDEYAPDELARTLGAEPQAADSIEESDLIEVRGFQGRMDIGTSAYRVETRDKTPKEALTPDSEPVLTQSALHADTVWAFPAAAAVAGIGASGILLGSVIAGWPAIKGGFLAPLFSRVHRGEALEHPLRRRLMDTINANPGVHLQGLVDAVDEPRSTVLHHLRTLERTNLVAAEHSGHYTCYFSKDRAARLSMKAAPLVKAPGARALLAAVAATPGLSVKDAAVAAGLSLSTAYYHVRRLHAAHLIDGDDGLAITSTGRATLQEVLH